MLDQLWSVCSFWTSRLGFWSIYIHVELELNYNFVFQFQSVIQTDSIRMLLVIWNYMNIVLCLLFISIGTIYDIDLVSSLHRRHHSFLSFRKNYLYVLVFPRCSVFGQQFFSWEKARLLFCILVLICRLSYPPTVLLLTTMG